MSLAINYTLPAGRGKQRPIETPAILRGPLKSAKQAYSAFSALALNQMIEARTVTTDTARALLALDSQNYMQDVFVCWVDAFGETDPNETAVAFKKSLYWHLQRSTAPESSVLVNAIDKGIIASQSQTEIDIPDGNTLLLLEFYARAGHAGIAQFEKFSAFSEMAQDIPEHLRLEFTKALWLDIQILKRRMRMLGIVDLDVSKPGGFPTQLDEIRGNAVERIKAGLEPKLHSGQLISIGTSMDRGDFAAARQTYLDILERNKETLMDSKRSYHNKEDAIDRLGKIGDRTTLKAIGKGAKLFRPSIASKAINFLAEMKDVKRLKRALKHRSSRVRGIAAMHLIDILKLKDGDRYYKQYYAYSRAGFRRWKEASYMGPAAYPALSKLMLARQPHKWAIGYFGRLGQIDELKIDVIAILERILERDISIEHEKTEWRDRKKRAASAILALEKPATGSTRRVGLEAYISS